MELSKANWIAFILISIAYFLVQFRGLIVVLPGDEKRRGQGE